MAVAVAAAMLRTHFGQKEASVEGRCDGCPNTLGGNVVLLIKAKEL